MASPQLQSTKQRAQSLGITVAQAADYGPINDIATWEAAIADFNALQASYQNQLKQ